MPSEDNALAKWQTFAERIRACTDAPVKEIGTGGATGTTESIDLTKDLAPEENGGVGLLCFAALQLSPVPMDDGETVAPEYSCQCVAANENRMVLMHALYWVASSEAPTADTLTWVRGTAWDAFVLQGEKIGVTVEELFTKLLVSEDFPFESDQTGDGVPLEPHAPMSVPEFTGTTLVECTDHRKAVIESGGFSAGARITRSTNVPEDGALDVPSHVVELGVLDTAGLPDPTKARSQWRAFAEAATGCGDVEFRGLPGTAALESTELPQETFALTKDLAPEDHGGVGVTCFAALQEEPNALDSVPEPGQRTTCVAADHRHRQS